MEETNKVFVGILNLGSMIFLISEGAFLLFKHFEGTGRTRPG